MKKQFIALLTLLSLVCVTTSQAHTTTSLKQHDNPWHGSYGKFGAYQNTGNTETSNIHTKVNLIYTWADWSNQFNIGFQHGTKNRDKNKQIFQVSDEINYFLTERSSLFFQAEGLVDEFSPYKYTLSQIVGYGYWLVDRDRIQLKLQAGPGLQQTKLRSNNRAVLNGIFGTSLNLHYHLNKYTRFNQKISAHVPFSGDEQYQTYKSKTALLFKMSKRLKAEASFNVIHYSDIPKDAKNDSKTETNTTLSFIYEV